MPRALLFGDEGGYSETKVISKQKVRSEGPDSSFFKTMLDRTADKPNTPFGMTPRERGARPSDAGTHAGAGRETAEKPRIAFLFLHEQPHQIPHCVPILNEVCQAIEDADIRVYVLGREHTDLLTSLMTPHARRKVRMKTLKSSRLASGLEALTGGAAPLRRIEALMRLCRRLSKTDLIATPSAIAILLKTKFGCRTSTLVYTKHGSGDRAVGYKPSIAKFDHVMVSGPKIRDRMLAEGVIHEGRHSVVGYPKFDCVTLNDEARRDFFGNDKPIVLYNPHFDPTVSSWFRHGEQVLDVFSRQDRYNLIFAPHVMLFSRQIHVTANFSSITWRGYLRKRFERYPNILVDTGSHASIDMTYTQAADIYLGDVSSQVYEFLYRPRPCLFLNSHDIAWEDDPNYANWHLGEVVRSPSEIEAALEKFESGAADYSAEQARAFRDTFGPSVKGGAKRAADALLSLLEKTETPKN